FTLGAKDLGLLVALGTEDFSLPTPLRLQDLRLLGALRREDRGTAIALGAHLLLHGVLDGQRRVDRLQLDAGHADAPLAGRLVEDDAQLAVDLVAARERLFEVEPADDVAERRGRELLD